MGEAARQLDAMDEDEQAEPLRFDELEPGLSVVPYGHGYDSPWHGKIIATRELTPGLPEFKMAWDGCRPSYWTYFDASTRFARLE